MGVLDCHTKRKFLHSNKTYTPPQTYCELMEMCEKYQLGTVSTKMKTKALITKLKSHMKKLHPIHKYISDTLLPQLKMLHTANEDEESLSEHDLPMTIANFYFKRHFESPLRAFLQDMKQIELKNETKVKDSIELNPLVSPDQQDDKCQETLTPNDEKVEKDFSILTIPSHLTESELKQLCIKHHFGQDFYQKNKTSVIEKELQAKLKSNHPIIPYLMKMSNKGLQKLYSFHGKTLLIVDNEALCKEVMEIYFAKHPLSPLTSLINDEKSIERQNLEGDEQNSDIQDGYEEEENSDMQDADEEEEGSEKIEASEEEEIDDLSDIDENDVNPMEDYPVLQMPTKLFREDLKKKFHQLHLNYSSNLSTSAMAKRLDTFLKDCHPIHEYIANLPYDQLMDIHKSFSNDPSAGNNVADLPSAIANHYFKQHHEKPLASLIQTIETMEEIEDLMQPIKKIKPPSITLYLCDFEDCSIEFPNEWSKAEIISELDRHRIPIADYHKKDIAKAKAKLAAILKKDHPIHNIISRLSYKEVSALTLFAGCIPSFSSDMDIARSKLANSCFETQPHSPITYLKILTGNFENLPQKEKKRLLQKYQEEMKKKIENELQC